MNPTVYCTLHSKQFELVDGEIDHDGSQELVKQYFHAECGCAIEVTLAVPSHVVAHT